MEGWIFMVGFRVFDVGLLILWLVWFFRLREDGSDSPPEEDEGGGGGGPERKPGKGPGGGGLQLPAGPVPHGANRVRDGHRPPRVRRGRTARPVPGPLPARVRSPRAPARVTRRA